MFPRRIVAFGASSIYGRRDPDGGGFVGRLRRWHEPAHPGNLVYNLGIGGETSEELAERFSLEAPRRKPQLTIIHLGINDARRIGSADGAPARSVHQHRAGAEALFAAAMKLGELFVVGQFPIDEARTCPYFDGESFYRYEDAERYAAVIRDLCAARSIPHLDLFREWTRESVLAFLDEDGLHCNAAGHQRIFHRLRDRLESSYGPGGLQERE